MIIIDVEQGSPEWKQARLGKVTASRMHDLMAKTKTGYSASRANYAADLIAEILTGNSADKFTNPAMEWGTANEAPARNLYVFMTGRSVQQVGLVMHPTIADACASPDGLVHDDGLVEIKCPNTATHIDTLLGAPIDGKYIKQMQWQMRCTDRAWCDFVSYDPRMPGEMQIHIERIMRDDALIREMESEATKFIAEIAAKVAALRSKFQQQAAE